MYKIKRWVEKVNYVFFLYEIGFDPNKQNEGGLN